MAKVFFSEKAAKQFRKLPPAEQRKIKKKLAVLTLQKNPLQSARKLVGEGEFGEYRFRIGDYRLLFDYTNNMIMILKVGHRKNIYK